MTSPGRSDHTLQGVTIAHNVHKGHGNSHRKTHCISNANMKAVNVVNVISQKYFEKKNLNKEPSRPSKGLLKGLGILRSQRSQSYKKRGDDPWKISWKRGW